MRNAWKPFFRRSFSRFDPSSPSFRSPTLQVSSPVPQNPSSLSPFLGRDGSGKTRERPFSSESAVDLKDHGNSIRFGENDKQDGLRQDAAHLVGVQDVDAVISELRRMEETPDTARRYFDFVSEQNNIKLKSKAHNFMLGILGTAGLSEKFWEFVDTMKKKGFGISKETYLKVSESFREKEMEEDFNLLKKIYSQNSQENVVGHMCLRVCKILKEEDESGETVKSKLDDLGIDLSSDLVVTVLERICQYPKKALLFFRWVEEKASFNIDDGRIYNVMARVLGREDCIEELWDVLHKIRNNGYEMEMETFIIVSGRFHKRKMIAAAVDLFEFSMAGTEKPSLQDFSFLLRKIVVSKDPDLNLISRVVRIFISAGIPVKNSVFDGMLKSMRSVGKLGECDKILKAMEDGGFVVDSSLHNKVVIGLCHAGRLAEALEYLYNMEKLGHSSDSKTWASLVQKHSLAGQVDEALLCVHKMIEIEGGENVGCPLEAMVNGLCQKNGAKDAYKTLKDLITKKNVKPWHSTYKLLIERLISQGSLKEASSLLGMMKSHGFPPFIEPFISYVSKSGTVDDALVFLKAMTVKEFPSRTVYIRLFEVLLKGGRHEVAHALLSKSPGSVRNHADVLDLFYSMKPDEATIAAV